MTPKSKEELRDKLADIQWLTGLNDKAWYEKFGNTKGLYGLFTSYAQNLYSRQDVKAICEAVLGESETSMMLQPPILDPVANRIAWEKWQQAQLRDNLRAEQRQSIDSIIDKWGK